MYLPTAQRCPPPPAPPFFPLLKKPVGDIFAFSLLYLCHNLHKCASVSSLGQACGPTTHNEEPSHREDPMITM